MSYSILCTKKKETEENKWREKERRDKELQKQKEREKRSVKKRNSEKSSGRRGVDVGRKKNRRRKRRRRNEQNAEKMRRRKNEESEMMIEVVAMIELEIGRVSAIATRESVSETMIITVTMTGIIETEIVIAGAVIIHLTTQIPNMKVVGKDLDNFFPFMMLTKNAT